MSRAIAPSLEQFAPRVPIGPRIYDDGMASPESTRQTSARHFGVGNGERPRLV